MIYEIIFYTFAAISIVSALLMIVTRKLMISILSLIVTFISVAGIWLVLEAEFLALVLILVYVGAIMTFFIFVIMRSDFNKRIKKNLRLYFISVLIVVIGFLLYGMYTAIKLEPIAPQQLKGVSVVDNTVAIGMDLYTTYAFPFVLTGILLLITIVACMTLVHQPSSYRKKQDRIKTVKTERN